MESVNFDPRSLPSEPTTYQIWQKDWPHYLSAYNLTFDAEKYATQQQGPTKDKNIMFARVAGFFLVELFNRRATLTVGPCEQLSKELQSKDREDGTANDVVFKVGKFYRDVFLRLFRTTTTPYPPPSSPPSRHSFDNLKEMTRSDMRADGNDYRTSRRKVLARDGYRCLLTGLFDGTSVLRSNELREELIRIRTTTAPIAACHILSETTMKDVNPTGGSTDSSVINKTAQAIAAMSILRSLGLGNLVDSLLVSHGVHSPRNLLSLEPVSHDHFDKLNLWFDHTDKPNRYQVCFAASFYGPTLQHNHHLKSDGHDHLFVTFSETSDDLLPDPQLLGLHAACSRVAHMSGAAEAFDEVERDVEDTWVLASNGSSAHLLDHLLTPFAAI